LQSLDAGLESGSTSVVLCDQKLLQRYRAAALRGISPKTFTGRLVNVLLNEINDSHNMFLGSPLEHDGMKTVENTGDD